MYSVLILETQALSTIAQYEKHERRCRTTPSKLGNLPDEVNGNGLHVYNSPARSTLSNLASLNTRISEIRTHMQTLATNGNQEFSPVFPGG